ncbi:NACHT and ankyrin domain protein [Paraphoma chrysanthemicola]|uniref:NACHT and ankyrin domain protein n=1 Tax=Paraphoma chrysanthemicola TaxID=798071 RepID=A0A8K0VRS7_9PLEO|nr:NACHT and ankyrin domain protein [Paraphoma chrysanthemicola]
MSTAPGQLSIGPVTGSDGAHNLVGVFNGAITIGRQRDEKQNRLRASENCRNALFVSDPYTDRETLISLKGTRVDGTCLWITKHENFLSWLRGRIPLLWISGGPGKGKTMISIFLSQKLEKVENQSMSHELVFFFCSQGDAKRNTALGILRSLIYQILSKSPQLVKHAEEYFVTPERTAQTLSSLDSLWIIFTRSITDPEFPPTRCVIDGLDECDKDTRRQLIAKLLILFDATNPNPSHPTLSTKLRLVVISRSMPELRSCTEIKIDPDNNQSTTDDIGRFVSARVQELCKIEGMTAEVQNHVERTLRTRAQGTFLWVGFAMHELLQQETCSDILDTLSKIPTGLFAIYSRMLSLIPPDRRKLIKDMLDWVTMAMRPLELLELAAAINIKPASNLINEEQSVRDAISACGPFLKIDDEVVTLVHQSARDYLLRETPDDEPVLEAFRIRPSTTHLKIAQACFECILFHNLFRAEHGGELHEQWNNDILIYSGPNVRKHVDSIQPLDGKLDNIAERMFLAQFDKRCQWWVYPWRMSSYDLIRIDMLRYEMGFIEYPPLHMACHLGIVSWIAILLKRTLREPRVKPRLEYKERYRGYRPLAIAAMEGHEKAVEYLIDHGAQVDPGEGWSPLYHAVKRGHSKTVAVLLRRGAKTRGKSIIHAYVFSGAKSMEIWKMLVRHKIDIHERLGHRETSLHTAAMFGSAATVKFLIEQGIETNATDGSIYTALHVAARDDHVSVVEVLLANGADPGAVNVDGETALAIAVRRNNRAVIQVLEDLATNLRK